MPDPNDELADWDPDTIGDDEDFDDLCEFDHTLDTGFFEVEEVDDEDINELVPDDGKDYPGDDSEEEINLPDED